MNDNLILRKDCYCSGSVLSLVLFNEAGLE